MKKSFLKKLKQATAAMLAAAMALGGIQGIGAGIGNAWASNELEDNANLMVGKFKASLMREHKYTDTKNAGNILTYGHSDSTGYVYGFSAHNKKSDSTMRDGGQGSPVRDQYTFDFTALPTSIDEEPDAQNKEGYWLGRNTGLMTSFNFGWWNTFYAFGKDYQVRPVHNNPPTVLPQRLLADSSTGKKNGQVTVVGGIEVRPEIKVSKDSRWIIVEYTVHNTTNQEKDFWIGNEADTMVYNDDYCPTIVSPHAAADIAANARKPAGLHLISKAPGKYRLTSLDILTYHPDADVNAGMQKRDASDPSASYLWTGTWESTNGVNHKYWVFNDSPTRFGPSSTDSAAAFSAYFNLKEYETKRVRFAVSMRVSTYYVYPPASSAPDASTPYGYITKPADSIQQAIDEIKKTGTEKANIFLMGDVVLNQTVKIPSGIDITIGTSDFEYQSNPSSQNPPKFLDVDAPRKVITRAPGFNGPMFEIDKDASDSTGLTISDVTIDGGSSQTSTGPIIKAEKGRVRTQKGAKLINNKINDNHETDEDKNNINTASAIDISGTASLDMNYGEITGNTGRSGSAVSFNGSSFKVSNTVKITGNKLLVPGSQPGNPAEKDANVKLGAGKVIKVGEDLGGDSLIGVSVADVPNNSADERVIAERANPNMQTLPYSAGNFKPDKEGNTTQMGIINPGKAVLKTTTYNYTVRHVNAVNNVVLAADSSTTTTAGTEIVVGVSNQVLNDGYKLAGVEYSTAGSFIFDANTNTVKGSMPATDVIITFKYGKNVATYKFDSAGGYPLPDMVEIATNLGSVLTMPVAARAGYVFDKWTRYEDNNGDGKYTPGSVPPDVSTNEHSFPSQVENKTYYYYASWTPEDINYNIEEKHKSLNVRLQKNFGTRTAQLPIDAEFTAVSIAGTDSSGVNHLPGYRFANGEDVPNQTPPAGHTQWDANDYYKYRAKVAAQDFNVNYNYTVDPSQKFNFKVIYRKSDSAVPIVQIELQKPAEQTISASPLSAAQINNYGLNDYIVTPQIIAGKSGNLDADGGKISYPMASTDIRLSGTDDYKLSASDPDFDPVTNVFSGYMPNQDVTIEYVYGPAGSFNVNTLVKDQEDQGVLDRKSEPKEAGAVLNYPAPMYYGYRFGSGEANPSIGLFDTVTGAYTGSMPTHNLTLTYNMARDPAYWRQMIFKTSTGSAAYGSIVNQPVSVAFLRDDQATAGRKPDTFAKIKERGDILNKLRPKDVPYYKFIGWFKDDACTIPVNDADTFEESGTVYAKFDEDPAYWINIYLAAGAHGTLNRAAVLHTKLNNKWSDTGINDSTDVTPEVNYIFKGWYLNGMKVEPSATLINGALYTAQFTKDPKVWGLRIGDFNVSGHIGADGSGQIRVRETQAGNVYIVSDDFGNVAAVKTALNDEVLVFDDLYPGSRYHVQEAVAGTAAAVGQPSPAPVQGVISELKPVIIPTLEDNYTVGFDTKNEGKAQITVTPADPDSDYAIIDEDGNVVQYKGSDKGWKAVSGRRPSTVTFDNLDIGKTYTVVARKKGDGRVPDPLLKKEYGTDVVANPGDMIDAKKFIVEVKPENAAEVRIVTVAGKEPSQHEAGSTDWRVTDAKEKDEVIIHAEPVNSSGRRFLYWVVTAGRSKGVSGRIQTNDFAFNMSASNIVLRAVYERVGAAEGNYNAIVEEEIRGGAAGEYAINPDYIPELEEKLTTDDDRTLIGVNKADVRYKIVFNKRKARTPEKEAVRAASEAGQNHPEAFNAAWSLDIEAERYVDGRLVERTAGTLASPSNAEIPVLIQLPDEDTDMMDYELFEVTDFSASPVPKMMDFTDPENTAGYCSFTGRIGGKYTLVYSKTFKLRFFDTIQALDFKDLNNPLRNFYHRIKVRRGDRVTDSWYDDYNQGYPRVKRYYSKDNAHNELISPIIDIYGVQHDVKDWSTKNMPAAFEEFIDNEAVRKSMLIFAYYDNNRIKKEQAYNALDALRIHAQDLARSPYLKENEIAKLEAAITRALARLNQKRGEILNLTLFDPSKTPEDPGRMATWEELQAELKNLGEIVSEAEKTIETRKNNFVSRTGGGSGGGSGSAGRGLGTPQRPFEHFAERTFTLGVDGMWQINQATGKWSFVLNGGLPLNDTWGKIRYADAAGKLLTKWYFFDAQSSIVQGWHYDKADDRWYFLNPEEGANAGQMVTGWYKAADGYWYYLDPVLGEMYTGWHQIGIHWYYFAKASVEGHPKGALYVNTTTVDGYKVNHDGEWIE